MNEQLSPKMKHMTKIYSWVVPVILVFCMAAACLIGGLALKSSADRKSGAEAVLFDEYGSPNVYSQLNAQGILYEFASDFKKTKHFYFVMGDDFAPYIVQIHGDLSPELTALQDYMYSEEVTETPDPVAIYGMSAYIQEDVRDFAIEAYNLMFDEEIVNEENFQDYFGEYYLDTTKAPTAPVPEAVSFLFLASLLLALAAVWFCIYKTGKTKAARKTLAAWPEEKLLLVDSQLNQPSTASYEKEKLYLTRDYIVSDAEGLAILPYLSVTRIYHTASGRSQRIMAETRGQEYHTLAVVKGRGNEVSGRISQLEEEIRKKVTERKEELFMDGSAETADGEVRVLEGMPKGFEAAGTQYIQNEETPAAPPQPSNLFLGLIGAVLGSLVGVALWVLIGQVGFIAGIAGFIMLKFALTGYGKLGRRVDKKGAILCLLVAAIMIVGANMLDYAVSMTRAYFQYEASFETLTFVFGNFTRLMTEMDMWGGFVIDLVIGYALSIWSSFGFIKAILGGRTEELV